MICPLGTESDINSIFDALEEFTDLAQWHFCLPRRKRLILLCPMKLVGKLDSNGTPDVYIPKRNLRGRKKVRL
jgi:hypothetical protein